MQGALMGSSGEVRRRRAVGLVRRNNLHAGGLAQRLGAGDTASQRDAEMGSQCREVLTYSEEPQDNHSQHLGMSLAEALCLGYRLRGRPGESHTPEM